MANTFDSALAGRILAGALQVFREQCWLAAQVNKDFSGSAAKIGSTVSLAVMPKPAIGNVTPSATPPALVNQTVPSKVITIDQWRAPDPFNLTTKDVMEYATSAILPKAVAQQARVLAYDVNSALFALYKKVSGFAGTAGTNPFATNTAPLADVQKVLNDQLCPIGNRKLAIGTFEQAQALKIAPFTASYATGDQVAIREGRLGRVFGIDVNFDQQRPVHTAGTGTNWIADGIQAAGATVLTIKSGAGTILEGDIVTFANHAQTYAVKSFAGGTTLTLYKALTTAVPDTTAMTLKASHSVNLAFDPALAFGLVMRLPPSQIEGAPAYGNAIEMVDSVTGIPMKLVQLPGYECVQWQLQILYGCELLLDDAAARLAGSTTA